ncbi:VOC family protein [Diaminobutyricibacter tongyongensis]|uniref:VOC family protein n=1 Tax=Leifsonia tongyongensis TaxID=1268043 RepID=A0A6L9XWG9_9MICO|nr:VOC family protein [Diaminobutyricibacter tongyongensis]NEN05791.1 VOC family protein [Diaminobutyricibacter tongyongensis]
MTSITPFLWFDDNAQEAIELYSHVFPDGRILERQAGPDGKLFTATIEVAGQRISVLNGGPGHPFSDAASLFVSCADQAEVDRYWDALTADGGAPGPCGWLTDRFGLSWQIIPDALGRYLGDPDPEKAQRVMAAMLQMSKIDVAGLDAAYRG